MVKEERVILKGCKSFYCPSNFNTHSITDMVKNYKMNLIKSFLLSKPQIPMFIEKKKKKKKKKEKKDFFFL